MFLKLYKQIGPNKSLYCMYYTVIRDMMVANIYYLQGTGSHVVLHYYVIITEVESRIFKSMVIVYTMLFTLVKFM